MSDLRAETYKKLAINIPIFKKKMCQKLRNTFKFFIEIREENVKQWQNAGNKTSQISCGHRPYGS